MTLKDFADELAAQLAGLSERSPTGVKVEILNRPDDWEEVDLVDGVLSLGDHVGAEQVRVTLADPGNLGPGLKWARARIGRILRDPPDRFQPYRFPPPVTDPPRHVCAPPEPDLFGDSLKVWTCPCGTPFDVVKSSGGARWARRLTTVGPRAER